MFLMRWLRTHVGRFEQRWIPNAFERARHQAIVSRRLRAIASRLER